MATIKFKLTSNVRSILALNDALGFSHAAQAADAILRHDDWQERWQVPDEEHVKALNKWREQTLKENEDNPDPNDLSGIL